MQQHRVLCTLVLCISLSACSDGDGGALGSSSNCIYGGSPLSDCTSTQLDGPATQPVNGDSARQNGRIDFVLKRYTTQPRLVSFDLRTRQYSVTMLRVGDGTTLEFDEFNY